MWTDTSSFVCFNTKTLKTNDVLCCHWNGHTQNQSTFYNRWPGIAKVTQWAHSVDVVYQWVSCKRGRRVGKEKIIYGQWPQAQHSTKFG